MNCTPALGEPPQISVIIASYNYAHYISESISSVLMQDVPSMELIVVDNASTDNTDEVLAHFSGDSRLRYFKNATNIGLAPNHNRGLELARGRYILFVSADDRLLPGHLRRSLDYLEEHPDVDMVYGGAIFIDAQSRPFAVREMLGQLPVVYHGGRNEFAAQLSEGCYVPWPSILARRELYDELGPLHGMTAADYELTVRWAAARKSFGHLRVPSVCIRLHAPQASGRQYIAEGRDLIDYLDILDKFVKPENWDLLQGYQTSIKTHLTVRASGYRESNGGTGSPAIEARIARAGALVAGIPELRARDGLGPRPLITVVLRAGSIAQTLFSLQSLNNQVDAPPWEAIVVSGGGADLEALLRAHKFGARVRFVRMDESNSGAARNIGQRLASGRAIAYLEPGNAFAPQHLAILARAFDAGALVVRSDVRFFLCESHDGTANTIHHETLVGRLSRGADDEDRDLIASAVPIDATAHLIDTIERTGRFRTDLGFGDVWEYWLRLKTQGVVFSGAQTVDVRVLRNHVLPSPEFLELARGIHRGYPAPEGSTLSARRALYIDTLVNHMERGPAAIADTPQAIVVLASLLGIEAPVLTPAAP
jgi:glycosyltransferase involved in cell wall biosynthesis